MKIAFHCALAFCFFNLSLARAQSDAERAGDVLKETEKVSNSPNTLSIVMWMPIEYWNLSISANPKVPEKTKREIDITMGDYLVFMAIDAKKGGPAIFSYTDSDIIRDNTTLTLPSGKKLKPLKEADLSPTAQNIFALFKPVFANLLGKMGEGACMLVFSNKDENGNKLVDSLGKGKMTMEENGHPFAWRLPLGSLLPAKVCPDCGESFPGNFDFCPYDGTKLKDAPPANESGAKPVESKPSN